MTATTERRRNNRAESCRSCGKECPSNCGYLYRDTDSRTVRRLGRFGWFVKCEQCHAGGKSRTTVAMERDAEKRSDEAPRPRPWSVTQARKWTVEIDTTGDDTTIRISGCAVSFRSFCAGRISVGSVEQLEINGKPLSDAAAEHLSPLVYAAVKEINQHEADILATALARLDSAGIEYTRWGCGTGATVRLGEVTLTGGYSATAIELHFAGKYSRGCVATGYDRRSGVSLPVTLTVDEAIALLS